MGVVAAKRSIFSLIRIEVSNKELRELEDSGHIVLGIATDNVGEHENERGSPPFASFGNPYLIG
jgi:hypothetical protein